MGWGRLEKQSFIARRKREPSGITVFKKSNITYTTALRVIRRLGEGAKELATDSRMNRYWRRIHDWLMSPCWRIHWDSWLTRDCFMIKSWLTHDWLMSASWLFMNDSWRTHEWFMIDLQLTHDWFTISSYAPACLATCSRQVLVSRRFIDDWFMNDSWMMQGEVMKNHGIGFMNDSCMIHEGFMHDS